MLSNFGDTPVAFSFQGAGASGTAFDLRPRCGVVPPKGHALVAARFRPASTRPAFAKAVCVLNGITAGAAELEMSGAGHEPSVTFDVPGSALYFR
jgi:hypothetical protein